MNDKNDTKSKSSKYEQARARALGQAPEETSLAPTGPTTVDVSTLPDGMLVSADVAMAELAARVKDGSWEAAPQLLSLKEGQTIIATLEGNGPEAEFTDEDTGEVKATKTWILSKDGVRVSILDTVQLSKKLPPFVGGLVSITRGKDQRAGKNIYTDYLVIGPRRADGSPRDWSGKTTQPQLAAPSASETKTDATDEKAAG